MKPKTYRLVGTLLFLLTGGLLGTLPIVVFQVAGGDWPMVADWIDQVIDHGGLHMAPPLAAGAITLLSLALTGSVVEARTILTERYHAGHRHSGVSPEDAPGADSGSPRDVLEKLVKAEGPLHTGEMHALLAAGGSWGPPVLISKVAMHKILAGPTGSGPAAWIAPRSPGQPYNHRDNVM